MVRHDLTVGGAVFFAAVRFMHNEVDLFGLRIYACLRSIDRFGERIGSLIEVGTCFTTFSKIIVGDDVVCTIGRRKM